MILSKIEFLFYFTFSLLKVIDDEVENNKALLDPSDNFAWEDPHLQVCCILL